MRTVVQAFVFLLTGCGGDPNPDIIRDPIPTGSAGGIWTGLRATGTEVTVFATETGEFRMLDPLGNSGHGVATVSGTTSVSVSYEIASSFGRTIFDGSKSATCIAAGNVIERTVLTITTDCVSEIGTKFGGELVLTYSAAYSRGSDLAMIRGSYDAAGAVLTVDSAGLTFVQNPQTGCVTSGQLSTLDPEWNLYRGEILTENCLAAFAALNGVRWTGLVALVDAQDDELMLATYHATIDGQTVGLVFAFPRI